MKKIKLILASLLASVGLISGFAMPLVAAQVGTTNNTSTGALNCGATGNITGTGCAPADKANDKVQATIKLAIRIFQVVVGLIAIFYVITGGLKYITSGGDSGGVGTAKNTILYAAIGLVVVALAEVVVQFVLNNVNSVTQL
jgi:Type IV secretion system pilin